MKRDSINYLVVGIFVLTLFAALLVMLYRLTGSAGPLDRYYVSYRNITGIKFGTPVLFEGYQIGQVERIDPVFEDSATSYRVTLTVTHSWKIRSDSIARIQASGLLSAVTINIREGKAAGNLQPGDFIAGEEEENLLLAVNNIAAELTSLSRGSLRPLLDNMNEQVTLLSRDYRQLANDEIRPLLHDRLAALLDKLNDSATGLQQVLGQENRDKIDRILDNLSSASEDVGGLLAELDQTRNTLEQVLGTIDSLVEDNDDNIRATILDLRNTMRVIARDIDLVMQNIESSSRNMNEFTRQIRENPGTLLRNSPAPDTEAAE